MLRNRAMSGAGESVKISERTDPEEYLKDAGGGAWHGGKLEDGVVSIAMTGPMTDPFF